MILLIEISIRRPYDHDDKVQLTNYGNTKQVVFLYSHLNYFFLLQIFRNLYINNSIQISNFKESVEER